jgi:short-subunit dehydrogenase
MALPPPRDDGAALVTGASSGIGEHFARALAERGYNLVLLARRTDRLEGLAKQLGPTGVRAEVVSADLRNAADVRAVAARVAELGLETDILVNNAGFGWNGRFVESDLQSQVGQIRVNVEALVVLTHQLLPDMVKRGSGAVINVASVAGFQPLPGEAVYSATKAFVTNFSEALHVEMRGTGVSVTVVSPGPVPTEWQEIAGRESVPNFPPSVSPEQVVRETLDAADSDRRAVIPGRLVRLGMLTVRSVPTGVKLAAMRRMGWE